MLTVVHVYHRWQKSEIRCFVNGQQIDSAEMVWYCGATEVKLKDIFILKYFENYFFRLLINVLLFVGRNEYFENFFLGF